VNAFGYILDHLKRGARVWRFDRKKRLLPEVLWASGASLILTVALPTLVASRYLNSFEYKTTKKFIIPPQM